MQLEHEDRSGGRSAPQPRARRYGSPGAPRARFKPTLVEVHPERDALPQAELSHIGDLTRTGGLAVSREHRADVLILSLSGELDLATSALLERELDAAQATRAMRLIVDLTQLEFIDSTGLKTLAKAHERATENGQQLSLRQGPRGVQRMFELIETTPPSSSMTDQAARRTNLAATSAPPRSPPPSAPTPITRAPE